MAGSTQELGVNWLDLYNLQQAIPLVWSCWLKEKKEIYEGSSCLYSELLPLKNKNRVIYDRLIFNDRLLLKYLHRWQVNEMLEMEYVKYQKEFLQMYHFTKRMKLRDFTYRLLLHKIILNDQLKEWGIKESDLCTLCNEQREMIGHLFYDCCLVKPLLNFLYELCDSNNIPTLTRSKENFLFNHINERDSHVINYISALLKQFVYKCRCKNTQVSVHKFQLEIICNFKLELAIAKDESRVSKHNKWWSPILESLTGMPNICER